MTENLKGGTMFMAKVQLDIKTPFNQGWIWVSTGYEWAELGSSITVHLPHKGEVPQKGTVIETMLAYTEGCLIK